MSDFVLPASLPLGALFSIINRTRVVFLNERLKSYNLSAGQYPVFIYLLKHDDVIQDALARYFHLDKGTIARTVKKMEDNGYISRRVDPDNRRAFRLSLTSKGYEIAPEILAVDQEWEAVISRQFSLDEKENLCLLLRIVAESSILMIQDLGEAV